MKPTVVFVDGPTGVGKDYFINQVTNLYSETYPEQGIRIIRAADITLSKQQTQSEERKYTKYQTPTDKAAAIFEGHLELLEVISSSLETTYAPGLVLVNRGLLSYLHYNIYNQPWSSRELYIQRYGQHLCKLLKKSVNVSVVIKPPQQLDPNNQDSGIEFIINRLLSRNDGKPIDESWLKELYQRYDKIPVPYMTIFDKNFSLHSGRAEYFLKLLTAPTIIS